MQAPFSKESARGLATPEGSRGTSAYQRPAIEGRTVTLAPPNMPVTNSGQRAEPSTQAGESGLAMAALNAKFVRAEESVTQSAMPSASESEPPRLPRPTEAIFNPRLASTAFQTMRTRRGPAFMKGRTASKEPSASRSQ